MNIPARVRSALAVTLLALAPVGAAATTLTNGDFSSNLDDWDRRVCALFCGADTLDLGQVANNGADPYLQMTAPSDLFGQRQLEVFQRVTIDNTNTLLTFDAGLLSTAPDPAAVAPNGSKDFFTLNVQTSTDIERLFLLDMDGAEVSSDPGPVVQSIMQNAPGSFFDFRFTADMSALAGQTVDLFFTVASRRDERISVFGVDNIAFSAAPVAPAPVPLPAGMALLISGLFVLRRFGRR